LLTHSKHKHTDLRVYAGSGTKKVKGVEEEERKKLMEKGPRGWERDVGVDYLGDLLG
jgi:hypothetical protein